MTELSQTFYDAMSKNRWRSTLLFALFPIMILVIIYLASLIVILYGGSVQANNAFVAAGNLFFQYSPWVIILSAIWGGIMVMGGKNMVLSLSGAKPVTKAQAPELYRLAENLAIRTGIRTPQVYIIEDASMNAFATGFSPDNAAVTVTTGILNRLDKTELEAVIAHEFGHIVNRDTRTMLIAITMTGILQLLADMVLRGMWYSGRASHRDNRDGVEAGMIIMLAAIVIWVMGFLGSMLVQLGISRKREFLADAESAYLTRNPQGLISALNKITSDARVEQLDGKRSIAALCIADPLEGGKESFLDSLQGFFSTHPSTKDRIEELKRMTM